MFWERVAAPLAFAALAMTAVYFSLAPLYMEHEKKKEKLAALEEAVKALPEKLERLGDPSPLIAEAAKEEAELAARAGVARRFFNGRGGGGGALMFLGTAAADAGAAVALLDISPGGAGDGARWALSRVTIRAEGDWRAITGFVERIMEPGHPISMARLDIASDGGYPPSKLAADLELEVFGF